MKHETSVELIRAWGEFRPECTCRWIGSYWPTQRQAQAEADQHVSTGANR